jgi:hypothetical protein
MEPEKFESYLTAEELENYKRNLAKNLSKVGYSLTYEEFVERSEKRNVIGGAFPWIETPERADYWIEINRRVQLDMPVTAPVKEEVVFDIPRGVDYMQFFTAEQWTDLTEIAMETLGMERYQDWINCHHVSIGSFIYSAIPTKKQSRFVQNIRIAESPTYRESRGYVITPGEFMTKKSATTDHDHVISAKRPDATYTWSEEFMLKMTGRIYEQLRKSMP